MWTIMAREASRYAKRIPAFRAIPDSGLLSIKMQGRGGRSPLKRQARATSANHSRLLFIAQTRMVQLTRTVTPVFLPASLSLLLFYFIFLFFLTDRRLLARISIVTLDVSANTQRRLIMITTAAIHII